MPPPVLSHEDARRTYDRIGRLQDSQAFYEDPATDELLRHAGFEEATSVFELGCGTGRLARRLLSDHLPPGARYHGIDLSPTMVEIARERLAPFGERAVVSLSDGSPPVDEPPASHDRFVSCYVFDLLSQEESRAVLQAAHRMLRPGGRLCATGLSSGVGPLSRAVAATWRWLQARRPSLVGGCRPIELLRLLPATEWRLQHHARIVAFGVPSEVVVAERVEREA